MRIKRILFTLLVAVMISTCAISGTFAKYVTEATGTDTARVAKFGVEVNDIEDYSMSMTFTNLVET